MEKRENYLVNCCGVMRPSIIVCSHVAECGLVLTHFVAPPEDGSLWGEALCSRCVEHPKTAPQPELQCWDCFVRSVQEEIGGLQA